MAVIGTTNISLATVRDTLNGAGGSVTNELASFFASAAKLNPYSKNKPVRYNKDFDITDTEKKSVNYGLEINGASGIVIGGSWNYLLPRGKNTYNEPYRLGDFRGYNTSSGAPIVSGVSEVTWNVFDSSAPNLTIYAKYNIGGSGQFGGVSSDFSIDDLAATNYSSFPLKDMRLVAAIDADHYAIADNTMGTTGNQSGISATKIAASTLQTALNEMTIGDTINIHLLLTNGTASALSWTFPFPVPTYIPITKVRKFYYQFYPGSVTLDWGYTSTISLSQGATPTVFPLEMKNNLKAQSSTKSMNISFSFRVYRAPNVTAEAISIGNLNVFCNAYGSLSQADLRSALGLGSNAYTSTEYLAKSAYTAADVLAKLKTVDGSGSGLDADTLDGYDSTAFVKVTGDTRIDGNLVVTGGVTMYSDIRKKTKLGDVELTLREVAEAPLIAHYYNSDEERTKHVGSVAQYWAGLNDWFCKADGEGYLTMEVQNAALASAISVARALVRHETDTDRRIRTLAERVRELEEEIITIKKRERRMRVWRRYLRQE